jgi:hypothetical protein
MLLGVGLGTANEPSGAESSSTDPDSSSAGSSTFFFRGLPLGAAGFFGEVFLVLAIPTSFGSSTDAGPVSHFVPFSADILIAGRNAGASVPAFPAPVSHFVPFIANPLSAGRNLAGAAAACGAGFDGDSTGRWPFGTGKSVANGG